MTTASSSLAPIAGRLAPIVARLSTPHDGEKLACVSALERVLASAGLGFTDLAVALETALDPAPDATNDDGQDDRELVQRARSAEWLSDWEQCFLAQLARIVGNGRALSEKQRAVVRGIIVDRC